MESANKIGAGIIAIDKQTGELLLGKRAYGSNSAGTFSPFGGTFELKDGNVKTTAKREFSEETGGIDTNYEISKTPFFVQKTPEVIFYSFLGIFDKKFQPEITNEHLNSGWFGLDNLPSNLLPGFAELIQTKGTELRAVIDNIVSKNNQPEPA